MTASARENKFEQHGLTGDSFTPFHLGIVSIRPDCHDGLTVAIDCTSAVLPSAEINAPGIAEAAIVLECRVLEEHRVPPCRSIFFAEVVRTSTHHGVTDTDGRLNSTAREFFGMTAG